MVTVKRRGNNEGYIAKRKVCGQCKKIITSNDSNKLVHCHNCGSELPETATWFAQVTVGNHPKTGKPVRKSFYGKTRKQVFDKMQDALKGISNGLYTEPSKISFGEWLDRWLLEYKKGNINEHTYESYQSLINIHIKPALGTEKIANLQGDQLQAFYNQKLKNGRHDGKAGLSTRMVRYIHGIIKQALDKALKLGWVTRNIADDTDPPKLKSKQIKPLTEDQILTLFNVVKDDRFYAAYVLLVTTGLRRGELLGLKWDCVDLEQGIIIVKRQLIPLNRRLELQETTKSNSSRRQVALTDDAIRELTAHKKHQDEEKQILSGTYQDNNLVFAREDGSFIEPRSFTKRFQRFLIRAGLPKVGLHNLRHTHATLLLNRGIHPKIVQERLGHSSITITLDLYSHLSPNIQQQAASSLDGLINPNKISNLIESDDDK